MDDLLTTIISLAGSALISFLVAKYYGERWVETRRRKREHSAKLVDSFFKPLLNKIGEYNDEYCKIDAFYSREMGKFVPTQPRDPEDLQFYEEAMSHLRKCGNFLNDWNELKQATLELNEELASIFEENRPLAKKEINLPYWCSGYSGDEPLDYLCPTAFMRASFDEICYRFKRDSKQFIGSGKIQPTSFGDTMIYCYSWWNSNLARSTHEELVKNAQRSFNHLLEYKTFRERVRNFIAKKEETYDKQLGKTKQDIGEIIKSIELGGKTIKGKCQFCS
jgi:hypothetical protein